MPALPDEATEATNETAAEILDVTPAGDDRFFAASGGADNHYGSIFGGRLIAQSLYVAMQSVADMPATSVHAYFLAGGRTDLPLEYRVARLRDSRRFANRQVTAWQQGRALFTLMCAFHAPEDGAVHQSARMPDVPPPEDLTPLGRYVRENENRLDPSAVTNFAGPTPVEIRPVAPDRYFLSRPEEASRDFWFRLPSAADVDDPRLQQCLAAYACDYWLAGTVAIPHAFPTNGPSLLISSLDHAMWFHAGVRCDEWMLHQTISPAAGEGIGLVQGRIFDRGGRLLVSTAQESLLRKL